MRIANAVRRYRDTITRRRIAPGVYDDLGEWIPAHPVDTAYRASVQPLGTTDSELVGGAQLSDRRVAYVPEPDVLVAAFDDGEADRVIIDGAEYVVTDSWSWPSYSKSHLLRET